MLTFNCRVILILFFYVSATSHLFSYALPVYNLQSNDISDFTLLGKDDVSIDHPIKVTNVKNLTPYDMIFRQLIKTAQFHVNKSTSSLYMYKVTFVEDVKTGVQVTTHQPVYRVTFKLIKTNCIKQFYSNIECSQLTIIVSISNNFDESTLILCSFSTQSESADEIRCTVIFTSQSDPKSMTECRRVKNGQ